MPERVARIRIELRGTRPRVWRRVDVPLSYTLLSLHEVIQAAFEWHGGHLWDFEIDGERYSDPAFDEFVEPDPFGWSSSDASKIRVQRIVDLGIKKFNYTYDYGDDWRHILTVLRVIAADPATNYPALVAGSCRSPDDDCGGTWGFYDIADAASDPSHPRRQEYEEWKGEGYLESFDLNDYDPEWVRTRLAMVAEDIG
ncbi:MAG: plasmid pRiA4b ORF-3 family protein [Bryobacterales bacterium]|nr:plasmid pRiA4b ORF-3 family protein [Bryobacterales bacterium]MDE0263815.1 plasmid pRiA4b ORF-3 family protein [Bryobacterales bacterium]MDE0620458.1 plasmid pRiA4b ORF-3 family protein [Bryobacterales bacterium]